MVQFLLLLADARVNAMSDFGESVVSIFLHTLESTL